MLFYPSHDIALGNGVKHFNPPAAARQLQEDLAWLADIWNDPTSPVPLPWGWDWDTRHYLHRQLGIGLKQLPTDEQLEALRQLSNRRTVIGILQALDYAGPLPVYLTTDDEVARYMAERQEAGENFVLKSPWSSSGRGLVRSSLPEATVRERARAVIRKMGGIMGEVWLQKKQDFAMLFRVGHEEVSFAGYSLFETDDKGTYRQGLLLSDQAIEAALTAPGNGLTTADLHTLRDRLLTILNRLFAPFFTQPWQVGYIGLDMMVTPQGIMPCVEMNVRCTMGVVSRLYFDHHMQPSDRGRFVISQMNHDNGHFEARFIKD